mgnify:CR=1 FL=1
MGIKDANNMGPAMAPAAMQTIKTHFEDFGTGPDDYDLIVTGDLGQLGKELLLELGKRHHLPLGGHLHRYRLRRPRGGDRRLPQEEGIGGLPPGSLRQAGADP